MKIKLRLTLLFTFLMTLLVMAFAFFIYLSSSDKRTEEYYKKLKQEALIETNSVFDSKISPEVLKTIHRNFSCREKVAVFDNNFNLLYGIIDDSNNLSGSNKMLEEITVKKEIRSEKDNKQTIGFLLENNGKQYEIITGGVDNYGLTHLSNIKYTLIISAFFSIVLTFFAGLFFSRQALSPVSKIIEEVNKVSAGNLNLRLDEGKSKDEIWELTITFNEMLERLENCFDSQKEFVSNVTHEIRNPLTAMITELQLSLERERNNNEYKNAIMLAIHDAQKVVKLSAEILDLAKVNYEDTGISFRELRLDEVLLDARNNVLHSNRDYKVDIKFEREIENENLISINGNEYLLSSAFKNMMENGCKYSDDNKCLVVITYLNGTSILRFQDTGVCIPQKDYEQIFAPFYRCVNKKNINGHGIGLTLVKKVIQLHKGEISVSSKENEGTVFTVGLPHL